MKLKSEIIISIFMLTLLACFSFKTSTQEGYPEEIHIHRIPQFSSFIVGVSCEKLKSMDNVTKRVIKNKNKIIEFYLLFNDTSNFKLANSAPIDSRMLIEYMINGKIVQQICWSKTGLIQRNGKVYTYNKKIESFLNKEGLIIVLTNKN